MSLIPFESFFTKLISFKYSKEHRKPKLGLKKKQIKRKIVNKTT